MLHHQIFRPPPKGQPLVLAVFSYRYDAHLVPDLLENLRPVVNGFVAWDDRAAQTALSDEPARRARLVAAARGLGADWLLTPDPDERFEQGFAAAMPGMLAEGDRTLWLFSLREMFSPTHYRSDGLWGAKSVLRLFPAAAAGVDPSQTLHANWIADEDGFQRRHARLNLYHLRMAAPLRRQLRRDLYAAADPGRLFQALGYDYLADDRGMLLEAVSPDRSFSPAFVEDGGLWGPDPGALGVIRPDPYETRLAAAAAFARQRGKLAARHVMLDLCRHSPDDHDLAQVSARFALEGGAPDVALTLVEASQRSGLESLGDQMLAASALIALGQLDQADAVLAGLHGAVHGSPLLAALQHEVGRPTTDFTAATAAWRQLAPRAGCHEGASIARSDLAVTVIGFQNQPGLREAVQSLLDQDEAPEIVVVNSGGGAVMASLGPVLDQIRLITLDDPLYVGAARNIGVAASRAPYLAFLAGDCLASPGWVRGRLSRHRAGAMAVATAVIGEADAGLIALAASHLRYATRHPRANPRDVSFYGQSYSRVLLGQVGLFPPGLRVGEDTALNRAVSVHAVPVWEPRVQTIHRDLASLSALVTDEVRRGQRRAAHPPFRDLAGTDDVETAVGRILSRRLSSARDLQTADPGLSAAKRRALGAIQWLAAQADRRGVLHGLALIAKANAFAGMAKAQGQLSPARKAFALDPQDAAKAADLGAAFLAMGAEVEAAAAYTLALSIDPALVPAAEGLVALVTRQQGPVAGWHQAENLVLAAPMQRHLWQIAAEAALTAGHAHWAVALGQVALARRVDAANAHARLARLHKAAGNPEAEAFRAVTARRLRAAAEARARPA